MALSLQAQILAVRATGDAAIAGTSADAQGAEVPWTPGQRLSAEVEAELPGGRHQIRVGAFQFNVDLPMKAQVGDTLQLQFVSASPRVAFALTSEAGSESGGHGTDTGRGPQVQISGAGRILTEALQARSAAATPATQSAVVEDALPLLPAPPDQAAPLAAALKGALDRSGLFYESHLAQWFAGERPLAALLREPQARLATPAQSPASEPEEPGRAPVRASMPSVSESSVPRPLSDESTGTPRPLDAQVLGQIRSQLDVIEQRQILWQGQAWPGQPLQWRIEEPPERGAAPDEPLPWTTHLRLQLPRLGEVSAELGLTAGHVLVRLNAETGATASALRDARSALTEALAQAGLALTGFAVTTDDPA